MSKKLKVRTESNIFFSISKSSQPCNKYWGKFHFLFSGVVDAVRIFKPVRMFLKNAFKFRLQLKIWDLLSISRIKHHTANHHRFPCICQTVFVMLFFNIVQCVLEKSEKEKFTLLWNTASLHTSVRFQWRQFVLIPSSTSWVLYHSTCILTKTIDCSSDSFRVVQDNFRQTMTTPVFEIENYNPPTWQLLSLPFHSNTANDAWKLRPSIRWVRFCRQPLGYDLQHF